MRREDKIEILNDRILISIIIPVYNVFPYLNQCIDSVLNQDYGQIEILLIDDGSSDGSSEICDEYSLKDNRIKVFHKCNGGASSARNVGINHAVGRYILFIDSDDFIEMGSIKKVVQCLVSDDFPDLLFLETDKVFPNGQTVPRNDGYIRNELYGKSKEEALKHLSSIPKFPGSACAKLISMEVVKKNNLFFVEGITAEDIDWMIRLIMCARTFSYCEEKYYYYRQDREGSASHNNALFSFESLLRILEYHANGVSDRFDEFKYSFLAYEYMILLYAFGKLDREERNNYYIRIKNLVWLLKYRKGKKNKIINICIKILGIKCTSKLLQMYVQNRYALVR